VIASDPTVPRAAGDFAAQRFVAEGRADVVRAFDQSSAIAQARAASVAGQAGPAQVLSLGGSTSTSLGPVGLASFDLGSTGLGSAGKPLNSNAAALAQVIQIAQSVVAPSSGRISSGSAGAEALASRLDSNASTGPTDLFQVGSSPAISGVFGTTGPTGAGAGSGATGEGNSARFADAGSDVTVRGEAGGGSSRTGVSSAQRVGSTFSAALGSLGGLMGPTLVDYETPVPPIPVSAPVASAAVVVADASALASAMPGAGVSSAVTLQALGGIGRADADAVVATAQSLVTADQLPVVLDRTAIDLARLRGGMLTLELAPADLGRLSFEMRIDDSGAAFVAIRLADDTVRALVENAAGALRDSLSREGFKLDSFTVSSGFGSPEQRENSQNQTFAETSNRRMQSNGASGGSRDSVQSRASNTQVRPGTSSLSLFA